VKTKDIAKNYGLDLDQLYTWIPNSGYPHKKGILGGVELDPSVNFDEVVSKFKQNLLDEENKAKNDAEKARLEREEKEAESQRLEAEKRSKAEKKQQALASMLITSGFNFEGFSISKYSGYISGDDVIEVDRPTRGWTGGMSNNVGEDLMKSLVKMRRNALAELKDAAYELGCNAVIGVDFDYLTLDPETVTPQGGTLYLPFLFGVTANGNAVVIEKK
jgi:uncharacterized protein YbjQ (UPF0145 family)